ncbi:thiocillin family RiPP [Streptomyces sp. NPDC059456]|uniref:thiocillin family RiPP n=1 Tax=Streptomyces sp. NPDC059456 TaxID=3346838 RepID=UPI00368C0234
MMNAVDENIQAQVEEVTIEDLTEVNGAGFSCVGTIGCAGCPSTASTVGSH